MIGPSGVGKSHIASALGLHLIEQGIRVKWFPATSLLQLLQQAKRDQACLRPRDRFWALQQNLWVNSGSGKAPSA